MSLIFKIRNLSASGRASYVFGDLFTEDILNEISFELTGSIDYEVEYLNERNYGRYITLENEDNCYFIAISHFGLVESRNSYMQSVSTAYTDYLNYGQLNPEKSISFSYYSLYYEGNNRTGLLKFYYRLMKTFGCRFLNEEYLMGGNIVNLPFTNVTEIINSRNRLRGRNSANQSSYITNEGQYYHFYGKTFGANSKETVLMCYAMSSIADKTIRLFQITDNDSQRLGTEDREAIESLGAIEIIGSGYDFDEDDSNNLFRQDPSEIRNQVLFNFNLLSKLGPKKCTFCDCKIDSLIHAAHIWPIAAIREQAINHEEKKSHAVDPDNGLWLCQNHHKLYDTDIMKINSNTAEFSISLNDDDINYTTYITTNTVIPNIHINRTFSYYISKRLEFYSNI